MRWSTAQRTHHTRNTQHYPPRHTTLATQLPQATLQAPINTGMADMAATTTQALAQPQQPRQTSVAHQAAAPIPSTITTCSCRTDLQAAVVDDLDPGTALQTRITTASATTPSLVAPATTGMIVDDLRDQSMRKRRCTSSGITASILVKSGKRCARVSITSFPVDSGVGSRVFSANFIASSRRSSVLRYGSSGGCAMESSCVRVLNPVRRALGLSSMRAFGIPGCAVTAKQHRDCRRRIKSGWRRRHDLI